MNRNALVLAAGLMGLTVLVAVFFVDSGRRSDVATAMPVVSGIPGPGRATFLDQPARLPTVARDSDGGSGSGVTTVDSMANRRGVGSVSGDWVDRSPSREHAYRAALSSAAVVREAGAPPPRAPERDTSSVAAEEQRLVSLGDSVLRTSASGGSGEGRSDHHAFLADLGYSRGAFVVGRPAPAGSPFTLRAGTVIPGLLLTGINSDLPGDLLGQVSRDVYDSRTERVLLVPKGSRLVGTYDNRLVAGENRLLVAWTRLIFPDGRSLTLPGLALTDRAGQAGIEGDVDTHWSRVFGKALLLSAIGAGAELSQPAAASAFAPPSAGQVAAGALGQELSNVALELIRRGMDAPPTITIPAGQEFNVFLNGDLAFDAPYADDGL